MKSLFTVLFSFLASVVFFQTDVLSQSQTINGYIIDNYSEALLGATVSTMDGQIGTTTDIDGYFEITVSDSDTQVKVSYIGYKSLVLDISEIGKGMKITMNPDILQMDEIVVSANFNEKSKLESSVSVSTLDATAIQQLAPVSAIEALKTVPGVYINDANGEVGVEILGRGLSTPYFSLQEDGLPSAISEMASNQVFQRDMFLRNDLMTERVEAVRGGSTSIIAANAPGGIFNYITRTGKEGFEFEFRNRFGLQANEQEVYNKLEAFMGGQLANTGWNYAVGGHIRYDGGSRKTIFPHSQGGQLKFNLTKIFSDNLTVKIGGKYLNDRVGLNRPTFVNNWNDIQPAPGFTFNDNLVLPDVAFTVADGFNIKNDQTAFKNIKTRDQQNIQDRSINADVNYNISENWRLKLTGKFSEKNLIVNHIAEEGGFSTIDINSLFSRIFTNLSLFFTDLAPMTLGELQFYDLESGQTLAAVNTGNLIRGRQPETISNNLPGDGSLFWATINNDELDLTEFVSQLAINGNVQNHSITIGGYYGLAANKRVLNGASAFMTVEENPRLVGSRVLMANFDQFADFVSELEPVRHLSNQTAVFNNSTGLHGYNAYVNEYNDLDERTISVFLSDEWAINDQINVDAGIRYEVINHSGRSGITEVIDDQIETGGIDGDELTVHDNIYEGFSGEYRDFNVNYDGLSYSAGINFKITKDAAVYGRYSHSEKLLDALYLQDNFENEAPPTFKPRQVTQTEVGLKLSKERFGLFAVGYLSAERNIFNQLFVISLSNPNGFYLTPPLLNSANYYGAEVEMNYALTPWWTLKNILNVSGGTNQDFKVWNTGSSDAPDDDFIVDLSGLPVAGSTANKLDLSPIDITSVLNFNKKKGAFIINYRRFAEKFANIQQAFTLPSFSLWKLGVSYDINTNISTSLNVNNVFDEVGLLRFNGVNDVAGYPENVNTEYIDQNPDQWFKVQKSPGRSFYLSVQYTL